MKVLTQEEYDKVVGGSSINEEEPPSLIGDVVFFIGLGSASGGFAAYMLAAVYGSSLPVLIGATVGGSLLGAGVCIGLFAALP